MKPVLVLLLICIQLVAVASASPLETLRTLRLAGNYQQALDLARDELGLDKNNARLLNELGELEYITGDLDAASAHFQQVIDLADIDLLMAQWNLAEIHHHRGEHQQAEGLYREIREAFQTRPGLRPLRFLARQARFTESIFDGV